MITNYHRANANASLISMVQRFSDITIIFLGLYFICSIHSFEFQIRYVLLSLIILVSFQMIGGITDFYRSWRGVKKSTELFLILKNWTLSFLIGLGVISLFNDIDLNIKVCAQWYFVVAF